MPSSKVTSSKVSFSKVSFSKMVPIVGELTAFSTTSEERARTLFPSEVVVSCRRKRFPPASF